MVKFLIFVYLMLSTFYVRAAQFDKPISIVMYNDFAVVSLMNESEKSELLAMRCEVINEQTVIRLCLEKQIGHAQDCPLIQTNTLELNNVARYEVGNPQPVEYFETVFFSCQ